MTHEDVAQRNLIFILIMAVSGLGFGIMTGSKSIITDGIVSTVILFSSYAGIKIHTSLESNNTKYYPYGKWRFEYVYNLFRLVTLLAIIGYAFIDSIYIIIHFVISDITPVEIEFIEILPYFIIKLIAVSLSLAWLKKSYKRGYIMHEVYSMEASSVKVDGLLTVAILLGIVIFGKIELIRDIADALTLLVVAIILGISIYKEMKYLIVIMIGKRLFIEEEQFIKDLIHSKYQNLHVNDVFLEKYGLVSMIYIQCYFDEKMTTNELCKLEREIKSYLKIHKIEKPRLHFFFENEKCDLV